MNLKELIVEVERLKKCNCRDCIVALRAIKQTVEVVDSLDIPNIDNLTQSFSDNIFECDSKDWLKLKELLGLK